MHVPESLSTLIVPCQSHDNEQQIGHFLSFGYQVAVGNVAPGLCGNEGEQLWLVVVQVAGARNIRCHSSGDSDGGCNWGEWFMAEQRGND